MLLYERLNATFAIVLWYSDKIMADKSCHVNDISGIKLN